jgi:hypothetical protein
MTRLKWADERTKVALEDQQTSPEARRQSLIEELQSIAEAQQQTHPPELDSLIKAQTGIATLRLAYLEEADGRAQAAKAYLTRAQDYLKQAGWRDYSERGLRSLMQPQPSAASGKAKND